MEEEAHGGFYLVCDHGKHRNAKRYNVTPKKKMHNRTVLQKETRYIISLREPSRNPHMFGGGASGCL